VRQFRHKALQFLQRLFVHPAADRLAASLHPDQANPVQLLYVMGHGRWRDMQVSAKFTNAGTHFGGCARLLTRTAAGRQSREYFETVWIGKSLKKLSITLQIIISIIRHVSNI